MTAAMLLPGVLLSFLATAAPTAAWAAFIWWCDRYEREPLGLVVAAFLWGALPAVFVSLVVELWLAPGAARGVTNVASRVWADSGVTPVVEEIAKGLALGLILLLRRGELDDTLDGILYGATIGFGFAMTENLFYFVSALIEGGWSGWGVTVLLRSVVFGLNHAFFTALFGAGVGYGRVAVGRMRFVAPLVGLAAAIAAHALHNLGTALVNLSAAGILVSLVSDSAGILLVAALIILSLDQERRWVRDELAGEVGGLLSPAEYNALLSSAGRRAMRAEAQATGGAPAARAAGQFQQSATELAFRKRRARVRRLDEDPATQAEIARLRADVTATRVSVMLGA